MTASQQVCDLQIHRWWKTSHGLTFCSPSLPAPIQPCVNLIIQLKCVTANGLMSSWYFKGGSGGVGWGWGDRNTARMDCVNSSLESWELLGEEQKHLLGAVVGLFGSSRVTAASQTCPSSPTCCSWTWELGGWASPSLACLL